MSEFRRNPLLGRWVIISPERARRPRAFREYAVARPKNESCAFCPGHEHETPRALLSFQSAQEPGAWNVRVVSNLYPALRIEGDLEERSEGLYDKMVGLGAHEVVIESRDHSQHPADFELSQMADIITSYRDRSIDLLRDRRFQYVLTFKNHGAEAGASMPHPHSQIIALPIVPLIIKQELVGSYQYFDYRGRCIFCDILRQEVDDGRRVVTQNRDFICYAPYASRFPFEMHILPKTHNPHFRNINQQQIVSLAEILRDILRRYKTTLNEPPFSYVIHEAPPQTEDQHKYHWHLELLPKLVEQGGFEWGTGFYINPLPPEEAARIMRQIEYTMDVPRNYLMPTTDLDL